MRIHRPILRTTAAALLTLAGLVVVTALAPSGSSSLRHPGMLEACFFLAGLLYTQLFEHVAHRFPMHRRIRFLEKVRLSHLKHHRLFHGTRFQTRDPEEVRHIAGSHLAFPVLLVVHYAALATLSSPGCLVAFLTAATLHYVAFEVSHWFTHLEDNAFDRALGRIPGVRVFRAGQIEHHRQHHELPEVAFNFNPPYLGDVLTGRMPERAEALGWVLPESGLSASTGARAGSSLEVGLDVPTPAMPAKRPGFRLWQRGALHAVSPVAAGVAGVAVIGVAVTLTFLAARAVGQARGRWPQIPVEELTS